MKIQVSLIGSAAIVAGLLSGCELRYQPGTPVVPIPSFDPNGTWQAGNAAAVTMSAHYFEGTRSEAFSCPTPACTSSGDFDAGQSQAASRYNFDSASQTPAVLQADSHVTVYSYGDGNVYINILGTGFSNGADPRTNPEFVRIPATNGYSTVQIYPAPGQVVRANYLGTLGCSYDYSSYLRLSFNGSNTLSGYVVTQFNFNNTTLADTRDNPSCDYIFAAYQADFSTRTESLEDEGIFFVMANLARNATDGAPALDRNFVADVAGIQFDHYFQATRRSSIPSNTAPGRARADINNAFISSKMVTPAALFSRMHLNLDKIHRATVRPHSNRPVVQPN